MPVVALQSSKMPAALALSEAERVRALFDIMGTADAALRVFPDAIRTLTFAHHDRWVKPLYEKHWPAALTGQTGKKLRFLTCNLYATAPYTVLFSSPRPPLFVRGARSIGVGLGLSPHALAKLAARAVKLAARFLDETTHRRIIQIAAFIAAVDHVLDHCMGSLPAPERGKRLRGVVDGSFIPDDGDASAGAFRFLRALYQKMGEGIAGDDANLYQIAQDRLVDYFDSEVKAITGVPDPSGCCWRMAGVLGTIDGLVFPIWRFAGEPARDWMYSVSLFIQVMDDWLDANKDANDIRPTPILTGFWTLETVKETWHKTLDGLTALASTSIDDPAWLEFVVETYRLMALETADAMSGGGVA